MAEMLYMKVADNIIERIQNGALEVNAKLSERKLAAEYEVSRTVIREAIKLLNEKGLVHTIYGKGSYVNIPDDKTLISKFEDAMDISQVEPEDVVEARELLEIAMSKLVLQRVNERDIQVLEELYENMENCLDDGKAYVDYDAKFHLAMSICTHNRVLSIMTGTLNNMVNREQLLKSREVRVRANSEHQKIIEALKAQNENELLDAIGVHIKCIRSHIGEE